MCKQGTRTLAATSWPGALEPWSFGALELGGGVYGVPWIIGMVHALSALVSAATRCRMSMVGWLLIHAHTLLVIMYFHGDCPEL